MSGSSLPEPEPSSSGTPPIIVSAAEPRLAIEAPPLTPMQAFVLNLQRATPRLFVAYLLMAACVGVFALMAARGVSITEPTVQQLRDWGANYPAATGRGEWWRLVTSMFLHIGILHLAANTWGLFAVGPFAERLFGNVGFLLLYFLSGIIGSLASYVFGSGATSAGASGAVLGIVGGLLAFTFGQHGAVPADFLARLRKDVVVIAAINLFLGFSMKSIDNSAHIGGFLGGLLCGLILRQRVSADMLRWRWFRNLICATVVPAALAACIPFLPPPPLDLFQFLTTQDKALQTFDEINRKHNQRELTAAEAADRLEKEALQPLKANHELLDSVTGIPSNAAGLDQATLKNFYRTIEEGMEMHIRALRTSDGALFRAGQTKLQEGVNILAPYLQKKP